MADPIFIVLLLLHVGGVVGWMGGAILFVSVITPTLQKMSPPARADLMLNLIPRYMRFVGGTSIVTVLAGALLYGYSVPANLPVAPTEAGLPYIQAGAILGLIVVIIAFGVTIPTSRKLVSLLKQGPPDDKRVAEIGGLQKRLGMAARAGAGLLGITLILMVIGAGI